MLGSKLEAFADLLPSFVRQKLKYETIGEPNIPEFIEADKGHVSHGGVQNFLINFDSIEFQNITQLIHQYNQFALLDFVEEAVDEIVDEAIVMDDFNTVVNLNLDLCTFSESVKKKIIDEFDYLKNLLKLDTKADEYFRRWYIQGRYYIQPLYGKSPKDGIVGFHHLSPYKIFRFYDEKSNKYWYYINQIEEEWAKKRFFKPDDIPKEYLVSSDHIIFVPSGLTDAKNKYYISHLHKAIKPANQLKLMEDSMVVYRFCLVGDTRIRTPEGYQYIRDLTTDNKVFCYQPNGETVQTNVLYHCSNGVKPVYRVRSEHNEIIATDTHPILVKRGESLQYVDVKDIQVGLDCFVNSKIDDVKAEETCGLYGWLNDWTDQGIISPKVFKLTNQLKRIFIKKYVGGFTSEEICNTEVLQITNRNKKVIDDVKEIWSSMGLCSSHIELDESGFYSVSISDEQLSQYEPILSIEYVGEEEVFDITVENELHNFIANGVPVHNTRSPERRAFYIDVGKLGQTKADQYVKSLMNKFKTRLNYDTTTGMINQSKSIMTMLEDYWLPRMGTKGTEVQTLQGGQQLGEITDVLYFKRRTWKALKLPSSRADNDNAPSVDFGSSEFSREELKFARFCRKLRSKFAEIFTQSLKIHLVRKGIVTMQEWQEELEDRIRYLWNENSYWAESKELSLLERRVDMLEKIKEHRKYFSEEYVNKNILRRTDDEIELVNKQIEEDLKNNPPVESETPENFADEGQ